jgi:Spy/CpxP family protein refolding chaperone
MNLALITSIMEKYKRLLFAFLMVLSASVVLAQEVDDVPQDVPQTVDPKVRAKVDAARIGLITNRLGLTPEQAEKFWPIYNEFSQKRMQNRQAFREAQKQIDPNKPDPNKEKDLVKFGLKLRQDEVDLEKDYSGRIMNVISAQQLLSLRKAEQEFRQLILNQLQQRRALQQRKENFRDKNQRLRKNKQ